MQYLRCDAACLTLGSATDGLNLVLSGRELYGRGLEGWRRQVSNPVQITQVNTPTKTDSPPKFQCV